MKATLAVIVVAALVLIAGLAIDARSTLAAYLVAWVAIGAIPLGVLCILMTSYLVRRAWTDALHGIMVSATSVLAGSRRVVCARADRYERTLSGDRTGSCTARVQGVLSRAMVLRAADGHLFCCALRIGVLAASRMGQSRADDAVGLGRLDRLGARRVVRRHRLGRVARTRIPFLDLRTSVPVLHIARWYCVCDLRRACFGRRIGATKGYSALLLSTILLWAYLHAMQYIVIWSANIPDEAIWYLKRSSAGWQFLLAFVALGQFVLPFFALLNARVRSSPKWLLALCGVTLVMRCGEASILILPAVAHVAPVTAGLMLLAALLLIAVILWSAFAFALRNDGRLFRSAGDRNRAEVEAR